MKNQKIKSFEDVCVKKGISTTLPDVSAFPVEMQKHIIADYKLTVIRDVINGTWVADWTNRNQKKWYPRHYLAYGGLGGVAARYSYLGLGSASSYFVSPLCCETEENADYFGENFLDIWTDYLLG